MTSRLRVGFVGLGQIGGPMARRLQGWPGGLMVYDVAADATQPFAADGIAVAASLQQLAGACDVVCVMVRDDAQVCAVVDDLLPGLAAGSIVVVHSTIGPSTASELDRLTSPAGVRVVDAQVSGGPMGASDGSLAIMVGGDDDVVATVGPVLEHLGSLVVHAGPVGAGTRMKLARNLMHFTAFTAAMEASRLAEAAGLDLVQLGEVVRHSDRVTGGPGAIMHRATAAPLAPDDPWFPILEGVRTLGEKDLGHALVLAAELGVDTPLGALAVRELGPGLGLPTTTTEEPA